MLFARAKEKLAHDPEIRSIDRKMCFQKGPYLRLRRDFHHDQLEKENNGFYLYTTLIPDRFSVEFEQIARVKGAWKSIRVGIQPRGSRE